MHPKEEKSLPVQPDAVTVLLGAEGRIHGPMTEQYVGLGKRGWLINFNETGNTVKWDIDVSQPDVYELAVLGGGHGPSGALPVVEIAIGESVTTTELCEPVGWRQTIGKFDLPPGKNTVAIRLMNTETLHMFYSIELVRSNIASQMERDAASKRANTNWLIEGKYGFMFHWTSQSQPRHGHAKPYPEAVRDFNVKHFVRTVEKMGAGHVILTTSHAEFWFPGPNDAIDQIMPDRSCDRDLISELADALSERGIRLMLYFHPGHDDEPWWDAVGFERDKQSFFDTWCEIIADTGKRYGANLAGWYFDDALFTYYPYHPPWKKMTDAARIGYDQRLVSYNSWEFSRVTPYQDVYFGELPFSYDAIKGHGYSQVLGSGILVGGRYRDLQAHIMTIVEENWVHSERNTEIGSMIYSLNDLIWGIRECIKHRTVPSFNLEVYQDGLVSEKTLGVFEKINTAIHRGVSSQGFNDNMPRLGKIKENNS